MNKLLEVKSLNAFYGRAQILFDVSLAVEAGEVVALMGRNGAGKSTTIKSIMGLMTGVGSSTGNIRFLDQDIAGRPAYQIARLGLGFVPEDRRIFTDLTVLENLMVGTRLPHAGQTPWTVERVFQLFPNLARMPDRPGGQMSGGEQQMLTVARTLMGNPRLVLLDEPSEGVAPLIVEQMAEAIMQLKAQGLAVLLSEQNFPFACAVSNRAIVLEKGQVKYEGSMHELQSNEALRRTYLAV